MRRMAIGNLLGDLKDGPNAFTFSNAVCLLSKSNAFSASISKIASFFVIIKTVAKRMYGKSYATFLAQVQLHVSTEGC